MGDEFSEIDLLLNDEAADEEDSEDAESYGDILDQLYDVYSSYDNYSAYDAFDKKKKKRKKGKNQPPPPTAKPQAPVAKPKTLEEAIAKYKPPAATLKPAAVAALLRSLRLAKTENAQTQAKLTELMQAGKPSVYGANISATVADREGGIFRDFYSYLIKAGTIAVGRDASVSVKKGNLRHSYNNLASLLEAVRTACVGYADKVTSFQQVVGGAAVNFVLTGTRFWAILFRISGSFNYFDYRKAVITLTYGTNSIDLVVSPKSLHSDVLAMLPGDNAGVAIVRPTDTLTITVPALGLPDGAVVSAETLNLRDI